MKILKNSSFTVLVIMLLGNTCPKKKSNQEIILNGYILYHFIADNSILFIEDTLIVKNSNKIIPSIPVFTLYTMDEKYLPEYFENKARNNTTFSTLEYYRDLETTPKEAYIAKATIFCNYIDTNNVIDNFDSIKINGRYYNFLFTYGTFPDSVFYHSQTKN